MSSNYKFPIENLRKVQSDWMKEKHSVYDQTESHYESEIVSWLYRAMQYNFDSEWADNDYYSSAFQNEMPTLLKCFELGFSEENGKMSISYWPDIDMRVANRRFKGKPGKVLRKIFSDIPDSVLELLVDSYRKCFDVAQLEVKSTIFEIGKIYNTGMAPMQNIAATYYRKSLSNSCMRNGKDWSGSSHPCVAFNSGDFELRYVVETESGKLAGRTLINIAKGGKPVELTNAPIYGVSELAINTLQKSLNDSGVKPAQSGNWVGARVLALLESHGSWCAPYLDIEPQLYYAENDGDEDGFLVISRNGNVTGNSYSGLQCLNDEPEYSCEHCGSGLDEDEICSNDDYIYCESCYNRLFRCCEHCEEMSHRDNMNRVMVINRYSETESQSWCDHCHGNDSMYAIDGDNWNSEDLTFCESASEYIPSHELAEYEYFVSDWDNECYSISEKAELYDGSSVSMDELDLDDWFESDSDGLYHMVAPLPVITVNVAIPAIPAIPVIYLPSYAIAAE